MRIVIICAFFIAAQGVCQDKSFSWKGQVFKGYFVTKDGRTQPVDDFTNLSEFHTFVYLDQGIIMPLPIVYVKSLTLLEANQIQIAKHNGEVSTAEIWDDAPQRCMLFTTFRAEATVYVRELQYEFHDESRAASPQSKISLCDVKKIVFESPKN